MISASTSGSVEKSSALVGVGLVLTSLLGAGQALILAFIIGPGAETDAFLAAYSAYLPFALFGASLRSSMVPLIGHIDAGGERNPCANRLVSAVAVLGLATAAATLIASPLIGWLLTRSAPAERSTTIVVLLLLTPAVYCQIHAGALSGALNVLRRFPTSIGIYVASSALALSSSAILLATIGILGAGVGLLLGAVVLLARHIAVANRAGVTAALDLRLLLQPEERLLALRLLAGTASAVSQQLAVVIALAALPDSGSDVTLYVYAYFLIGICLNLSVLPLTWVTLPDAVDAIGARGRRAANDYLAALAPVVYAFLMPALALLVTFGHDILQGIFGSTFTEGGIQELYDLASILCLVAVTGVVYFLALSMLLARREWAVAARVACVAVGLHVLVIGAGPSGSATAVATCHSVATALSAAVAGVVLLKREFFGTMARLIFRVAPITAITAVFPAIRFVIGWDLSLRSALLGGCLAMTSYFLLLLRLRRPLKLGLARW
jgi:peptidoglycan biosynthesis protein MviN/MurJ (putative lipid II flippase)